MSNFAVLIDWRPAFMTADNSLLLAPVGTGSLLGRVLDKLRQSSTGQIYVLPEFPFGESYVQSIGTVDREIKIVTRQQLHAALLTAEPADRLLMVDSRYASLTASDLIPDRGSHPARQGLPMAEHVVLVGGDEAVARERVVLDTNDCICRIQRLYDGFTDVHVIGVASSLVTVAMASRVGSSGLGSPVRLRTAMAAQGLPSRDTAISAGTLDLFEAGALLLLNERSLQNPRRGDRDHFIEHAPGVLVSRGCEVHPSCRLIGPVVLHEDVLVSGGVTLVGPVVAGRGATIGRGSVLCDCVILPNAEISPRTSALHGIQSGRKNTVTAAGETSERGPACATAEDDWGNGARIPRRRRRIRAYLAMRSILERMVAAAGLTALSPLLLVVAALVKVTSRGPVLYGDEREGKAGRPFRCLKFRSMQNGAHARQRELARLSAVDGPQFKIERDPRVTPLGRWLRMTNIDELPQLINVVRGEMSLIGPRPSPFRENQICVPWRNARLSVRPGITGLWQICRNDRGASDFHQWIQYDIAYVRHLSPWLDFKILIATLLTFGGRWNVPANLMLPRSGASRASGVGVVPAHRPIALPGMEHNPASQRIRRAQDDPSGAIAMPNVPVAQTPA